MCVFGLAAAGSAGNASDPLEAPAAGVVERGVEWEVAGADDAVAQGVAPIRLAPGRGPETKEGKGLEDDEEEEEDGAAPAPAQATCLFAGERDDCAVELLSFNMRRPPLVVLGAVEPRSPDGPGRVG